MKPSGKSVSGLPVLLVRPVNLHANQKLQIAWSEQRTASLSFKLKIRHERLLCKHFTKDDLARFWDFYFMIVLSCLNAGASEEVSLVRRFIMELGVPSLCKGKG